MPVQGTKLNESGHLLTPGGRLEKEENKKSGRLSGRPDVREQIRLLEQLQN